MVLAQPLLIVLKHVVAAIKLPMPVKLEKVQTKGEGVPDYVKEEYKQDQIQKLEKDFAVKLKVR